MSTDNAIAAVVTYTIACVQRHGALSPVASNWTIGQETYTSREEAQDAADQYDEHECGSHPCVNDHQVIVDPNVRYTVTCDGFSVAPDYFSRAAAATYLAAIEREGFCGEGCTGPHKVAEADRRP